MNNTNYPVGDFLIRIKNASMAGIRDVTMPKSKIIRAVAETLKEIGYIKDVKEADGKIIVRLTFVSKRPLLTDLKLISKPGLRIYKSVDDLEKYKGPSVFIISTPKGIMSAKGAIKKRVGGEIIAKIT